MKILITGSSGFIGSNLTRALLEQGHKVTCLDNNYTGARVISPHCLITQTLRL